MQQVDASQAKSSQRPDRPGRPTAGPAMPHRNCPPTWASTAFSFQESNFFPAKGLHRRLMDDVSASRGLLLSPSRGGGACAAAISLRPAGSLKISSCGRSFGDPPAEHTQRDPWCGAYRRLPRALLPITSSKHANARLQMGRARIGPLDHRRESGGNRQAGTGVSEQRELSRRSSITVSARAVGWAKCLPGCGPRSTICRLSVTATTGVDLEGRTWRNGRHELNARQ